jgi:hypothetical protein
MAQKVFQVGEQLAAADVNTYLLGEGGAWSTWTPAIVQSAAVTTTVNHARYARFGRTIHFSLSVTAGSSGTSDNVVTVSLPVTARAAGVHVGFGRFSDASVFELYDIVLHSTTTAKFVAVNGATGLHDIGTTASGMSQVVSGDDLLMSGFYEAAS